MTTLTSGDGSTTVKPHFAPLGGGRDGGVVIFLEDTSLIAERVQQAKLAALGRLSASIAHEIRNPIGAMSHAGQLLAESPGISGEEHRLTDIIRVNARRVSQIVESVLALSRRDKTRPERLQVMPWLEDFAREFTQTLELYQGAVTVVEGSEQPRSRHGSDALASGDLESLRQCGEIRERHGGRDRGRAALRTSRDSRDDRSSRSRTADPGSIPRTWRRSSSRSTRGNPAALASACTSRESSRNATALRCGTTRGSGAAAPSAWFSRTLVVGILVRQPI